MAQNYFRLIYLLTDIVPRVLRKSLEDQWQRAGYSSLSDLLKREKQRFDKSRTQPQWKLLYQDTGTSATLSYTGQHPCKYQVKAGVKLEDLDITLLCFIIDKVFPGNTALGNIRKHRNEVSHFKTTSISDSEFQRLWFSVKSSILQIANTLAAPFPTEIEQEIDELEKRSMDPHECERLGKIVHYFLEDLSSEVTAVKHKVESTEKNVETMKIKVETIETNVQDIKTNKESIDTKIEDMKTNIQDMKTKAETTDTNVETMKTTVETTDTNVEAMKTIVETTDTNVETMKIKVETIETNVQHMKTKEESTDTKIEDMKTKVETTDTNVEAMKTIVESTDTKIEDMKTIVETTDTNIEDMKTNIQEMKTKVETTDTNIEAMKTKVETIDTNVEAMKTKVETTDTKIEDMKTNIQEMKTKVETTDTNVEAMKTKVETIDTNVEAMKTKVETTDTKIEDMKTNIQDMKTKVETTDTNVEAMKTKVGSTESNVKSMKTDVESMKAEVKSLKENVESIDGKIDATKTISRHPDIERRIENTESELKSQRNGFYVSLGVVEEKAQNRLLTKHLVTIAGRAGSGKTSLGKQLMIKYCDQHREADGTSTYTPVIISKPEDFDKISSKDRLVVFIDDPFGASNIDDKVLKEWGKHFEKLLSYCNEGSIRVIIGVRSNLISEPEKTFRNFDLFSKENILDLSSKQEITSKDKLQLLKSYCKEYKVQITEDEQPSKDSSPGPNKTSGTESSPGVNKMSSAESYPGVNKMSSTESSPGVNKTSGTESSPGANKISGTESSPGANKMSGTEISPIRTIQMSVLTQISKLDTFDGFPLACFRFFTSPSFFDQGTYFFTHAADILMEEISKLEKRENLLYFTLAFMLLEGGRVDLDNINEAKLSEMNHGLGQKNRKVDIKDTCKSELSKVYIDKDHSTENRNRGGKRDMRYKFTHQTVLEAVLMSLWERHPELVLQSSCYRIIEDFVRPSGYNQKQNEICVNVPPGYDKLLAQKVVSNGWQWIVYYRGVSDASFVEDLLDVIETTGNLYRWFDDTEPISLSEAINELLQPFFYFHSPLQKAICTRYTHNGYKYVTPGTKQQTCESPCHPRNKRKLIHFDVFLEVLNHFIENGEVDFVEQLMKSHDIDPMSDYEYRNRYHHGCIIVPVCYAAERGYKHLLMYWMKKPVTVEKHDHLCLILDKCCGYDWADILEQIIQNHRHGKHEKVLSPSSIYSNAFQVGRQMTKYFLQSNTDIALTDKSGNTLLHHCSTYGLKTEVLMILKKHPEIINTQNEDGQTAICLAAMLEKRDTVKELLQHGADITLADNSGNTSLHHCSKYGFKTEVLMILEKHPQIVNVQNEDGQTAICLAAMHKEIDSVKELLQHGADITLADNSGNTLLHHYSKYGFKTEVLMILKKHPEIVNVQNKDGQTAICLAAMYKEIDTVKELLQHGADITLADNSGNTLLHHCSKYGLKTEVLMILKKHPEIVNVQNEDGQTAICLAAMDKEIDIVKELLQHGADITLADNSGNTLLHHCSKYGFKTEVLMILKKHPEILNVQNQLGETAICLAVVYKEIDIVKELLQHGADITLDHNFEGTLLHHCSRYGFKTEVLMILEKHPEIVNVQNQFGQTAICLAAMHKEIDIVKELLQHGADITLTEKSGNTLLHYCSKYGFKTEVLMILKKHPEIVNEQNKDGQTAIFLAAMHKERDIVKELLQHGADITLTDKSGDTLLHYCSRFGLKTEILMILKKHPEIVNVQNKGGQTAIWLATMGKKRDTVKELLQHGADVTLTDNSGNTLLHHCSKYGLKTEVLMILKKHPEIVNEQNNDGQTATCLAAMYKEIDIVKELLQHGADITLADNSGNTLLHHCSKYGFKTEVLIILKKHPEILNVQNEDGQTAICLAAMHNKRDTVKKLLQHVSDITLTDNSGNTLLHHCSKYGFKTEVLMILKKHPEIVNEQNKGGQTAIFLAAMYKEIDIVKELLQHGADITLADNSGNTLLHHCSKYGFKTEVLMILKKHPEIVNELNKDGQTAICLAAMHKERDIVKELLQHGADITLADNSGNTLLHHCSRYGFKTEVLMILEKHPEIVNVQNKNGKTAMCLAAMYKEIDIVKELLQHGAGITLTDKSGDTLLHHCSRYGFMTEVLMILEKHPEIVNVQNKNGKTAICLAAMDKEIDIVKELLQHGADITLTDKSGDTLLHYCSRFGLKTEVLMILKKHPEIVDVQNEDGQTAICLATMGKKRDTVKELLQHGADFTLADNSGNTLLHHCSKYGFKTEVLMILKKHPEIVNELNKDGQTAICLAAMHKERDIVKELLQHGADITLADNSGNTLLHHCSKHGFKTEVLIILKKHPEILNVQNQDGQTAICLATLGKKRDTVKELLQHGADFTLADNSGNTLLHHCSKYGFKTEVLMILKKHPEIVNELNKDGQTAICLAVMHKERDIVKELLQHGADITLADNSGNTLLHHCSKYGFKTEVLIILKKHPEILNVQNQDGQTAICLAAEHKRSDTVKELLQLGADITLADNSGNTLLHHCTKYGFKTEVLMILKQHPEIVNVENEDGQTAIFLAAMGMERDTVIELLQHGADITLTDKSGDTLLHHCSRYGFKTEVLMILKKHPEIVNVQSKDGQTAICLAAKHEEIDIVKELLQHGADVSIQDNDGNTLLHHCAVYDWDDIIQRFVTNTMVLEKKNKKGFSPGHIAVLFCRQKVVKTLTEAGVNLQHTKYSSVVLVVMGNLSKFHRSAFFGLYWLHSELPSEEKCINYLQYLIRHNESVVTSLWEPLDDSHYTVIHYYILGYSWYYQVTGLLPHIISKYPRAIHARNKTRLPTALHLAAYLCKYKLFVLLYDAGVRITDGDLSIMDTIQLGRQNAGKSWHSTKGWLNHEGDCLLQKLDFGLIVDFRDTYYYEEIQKFYTGREHRR